MHYIYILKSLKDGKHYTGFSSDLKSRLKEHNSGNVQSTKNRKPLKLIYYEAYKEKAQALRREKFLKITKGKLQLKKTARIIRLTFSNRFNPFYFYLLCKTATFLIQ